MMVKSRASDREDRLYDEYSYDSMQPSDEWDDGIVDEELIDESHVSKDKYAFKQIDNHSTTHEEESVTSRNEESRTFNTESFFSHRSSFADYLSHLVPTFSVQGSKVTNARTSFSTATYSKEETVKPETKANNPGSSQSRCFIENTESIQDRQDEHKQAGLGRGRGREEEDYARDQCGESCSVEEISQISEITMDVHTVVAEEKSGQCSALPTISEVKQFNSPISATCTSGIRSKAQCSAVADTTTNDNEGNNDIIDFVFSLVEDALCTPMKTSKKERKKVFMEAFYEESEKATKLAKKNASRDPFRESSKHSRSSKGSTNTKRSANRTRNSPSPSPSPLNNSIGSTPDEAEISKWSTRKSDNSTLKIVDKPPLEPTGLQTSFSPTEEQTMDWSKMMSLAEKQLEAEEKSVISEVSEMSEVNNLTFKNSLQQSISCDEVNVNDASESAIAVDQSNVKPSVTSSVTTSSSTHATFTDDVVKELRELSALDSSSFEEESRFLITSTLLRFMRKLYPNSDGKGESYIKDYQNEEMLFDEISEASISFIHKNNDVDNHVFQGQDEEFGKDDISLRIMRFIAFVYAFVFWPQGIKRRTIQQKPLNILKKRVQDKPTSLLQLVNET